MTKFSMSLIAAVLALASTATLNAQIRSGQAQIKVPFAFEVDSVKFAPGVYTLNLLNHATLNVTGADRGAFTPMMTDSNAAAERSKVVFRRVGDRYFLREVWEAGSAKHLVAYESKAEKQARKQEQAAQQPGAAAVEIALGQTDK